MTVKELSNYLRRFPEEEEVRFVVLDLKSGMIWQNDQISFINHIYAAVPAIGLRLNDGEPFDGEMTKAAEEDERSMEAKRGLWARHYRNRFEKVK